MAHRVCVGCGEPVEPGDEWADHISDCLDLVDLTTVEVADDV